ncbi:MAG: hypothetical protein WCA90_01900 [Ilumatobacteraceae bacterium]
MSVGEMEARSDRSEKLRSRLAVMTDAEVLELVLEGEVLGAGIGGTRSLVVLDDVSLFVKRVPLTDLERLPANVGSTANLFDLPTSCHYGVGSPSFGVWREVAANSMTTSWVASGSCGAFPMLHHWRALSFPAFEGPLPDELGDIEAMVAHWHGSPAVRRRVEAIAESSAAVALFFEYIPRLLSDDLDASAASGDLSARTLRAVHRELMAATAFMNSSGLLHFDTHLGNVLSNQPDIYLADLGLASSASFDLAPRELEFLDTNKTHDVAYLTTRLLNWVVTNLGGIAERELRDETIRRIAAGEPARSLLPDGGAAIVERFAPLASIINSFYERLHGEDRNAPYPATAVKVAWSSTAR